MIKVVREVMLTLGFVTSVFSMSLLAVKVFECMKGIAEKIKANL
jgi:hypothetical protein